MVLLSQFSSRERRLPDRGRNRGECRGGSREWGVGGVEVGGVGRGERGVHGAGWGVVGAWWGRGGSGKSAKYSLTSTNPSLLLTPPPEDFSTPWP